MDGRLIARGVRLDARKPLRLLTVASSSSTQETLLRAEGADGRVSRLSMPLLARAEPTWSHRIQCDTEAIAIMPMRPGSSGERFNQKAVISRRSGARQGRVKLRTEPEVHRDVVVELHEKGHRLWRVHRVVFAAPAEPRMRGSTAWWARKTKG
jgi:hypothetical protein